MRSLFLASGLLAAGSLTAADDVARTDLFEAKTGGYATYRIPGIVVTAKGTVLAYCEARTAGGDWGAIDLVARRGADKGKTWTAPAPLPAVPGPHPKNPVAVAQKLGKPGEVTYNNPVMIADRAGPVHLLFCIEYMRCFYARSDDDGATWSAPREITAAFEPTTSPTARTPTSPWSAPREITAAFEGYRPDYAWRVLATGPGHGIQLKSGRLVVPVWLSTGTGGHAHRPSVTSTVVSDDGGATWKRGDIAVPNTPDWVNPNEATVAELPDGRVMLNARSESKANRRLVTTSPDGATGWSRPAFDDALPEPVCFGSLLRLPGPRPLLVFSNPDTLERTGGKAVPGGSRDRKNLSLRTSADGGKTWAAAKAVEPGFSAYSDLAPAPEGGVYLFYERAGADGAAANRYGRLTLARVPAGWLRAE
ncbi:MAG TPA: sialidase family protein [Urbifossiella sp.]|nr:sialidase family protein [Urbifossiella sp.]